LIQLPLRISLALALFVGLIARHDLRNDAVGEMSFSNIFSLSVSRFSSFPRISVAVSRGEVMYESEKSGLPVSRRYV
jgi:hypothetical protein